MANKPGKFINVQGIQMTPHFALSELIDSDYAERHGIDNVPNSPLVMANLYKLAEMLEKVRKACGDKPLVLSSAYRSPKVNAGVGGSATSDHMTGSAGDFRVPGFGTPLQVARAIVAADIKFGQLLMEGNWVHLSLPDGSNDGQVLTVRFVKQVDGTTKAVYTQGLPA